MSRGAVLLPSAPPPAKQLVVNADDFGVDIAVNAAIEQAYLDGILTSASLMISAPAAADAIERARRMPGLGVGLHVVLTDGRPTVSPRHIPALLDAKGRFRDNLVGTGFKWFFDPFIRTQLTSEINAQFKAFIATGLVLDHVNLHKHLQAHPTIGKLVVNIGRRYGMLALRVPNEPQDILQKIEPKSKLPKPIWKPLLNSLRRRIKRSNLLCNDRVFGLAWSGAMTEDRLLGLIEHLPDGLTEIYTHPAAADAADMPHAVATYKYREELAALLSPKVRAAIEAGGITLTRYSRAIKPL